MLERATGWLGWEGGACGWGTAQGEAWRQEAAQVCRSEAGAEGRRGGNTARAGHSCPVQGVLVSAASIRGRTGCSRGERGGYLTRPRAPGQECCTQGQVGGGKVTPTHPGLWAFPSGSEGWGPKRPWLLAGLSLPGFPGAAATAPGALFILCSAHASHSNCAGQEQDCRPISHPSLVPASVFADRGDPFGD